MSMNYNHTHQCAGMGKNVWCLKLVARVTESYRVVTDFTSLSAADSSRNASPSPSGVWLPRRHQRQTWQRISSLSIETPHRRPAARDNQSLPSAAASSLMALSISALRITQLHLQPTDRQAVLNICPTHSGEVIACRGTVGSMSESQRKVKTKRET